MTVKLMSGWFSLQSHIGFRRMTRAAEMRSSQDAGAIQQIERVSVIMAHRDIEAGRLDAAAGCEFVDDRIRLRE